MNKLLVLTFLLFPIHTLWASDNYVEALGYLKKMGQALNDLNYHGTLVYINNGHVETMDLIHKNDEQGEHERLVHLSGAAREVVRVGDVVTCYLPDSKSVVKNKRRSNNHLLSKLKTDFNSFADYYSFELNGEDRVAGRSVRIILVKPKDEYRYGYRLSLDLETNLLLKSELLDANEQVLEQMMFANISIVDTISAELLKPAVNGDSFAWHNGKDDKIEVIQSNWEIDEMPNGFTLTGHFKQPMPNSDNPADHMVISDGLASISIYIENVNVEAHGFVGASSMGAINIYGSVLEDYKITVVGEVPELTVQMIAKSLKIQNEKISAPVTAGEGS